MTDTLSFIGSDLSNKYLIAQYQPYLANNKRWFGTKYIDVLGFGGIASSQSKFMHDLPRESMERVQLFARDQS